LLSLSFESASDDATQLFEALKRMELRARDSSSLRKEIEDATSRPLEWIEKTSKKMNRKVRTAQFAFDAFHLWLPLLIGVTVVVSAWRPMFTLVLGLVNTWVTRTV